MSELHHRYDEWEKSPPPDLFGDPMWRLPAFRISTFLAIVVREDSKALLPVPAAATVLTQLERSINSISANLAEGYGRFSGRERARYFEFALGSAREAREWYRRSQEWLGAPVALERAMLLTRIIKILVVAIPQERAGSSERRMRDAALRGRHPPGD